MGRRAHAPLLIRHLATAAAPLPTSYLRLLPLILLLLLLTVHPWCTTAAPFSPDDNFTPFCGSLLTDPPPNGWKNWSSTATWPDGVVPGVGGAMGANVTIPCGVGVLLDLPLVYLTVLDIQGALKFKDSPSLPLVNLTTSFVIVEGRFIIGTLAAQFSQRAEIRLAPNPNGRANYTYTNSPPADAVYGRNVGHKAFAILGGQVDFHGLPGPSTMLTWTKLVASARVGDSSITVKGDVSSWPVGAPLVIAPSDYFPDQEDVRNIKAVSCSSGSCKITLDANLTYNHFGDAVGVPDGFGGFIDETAEVALLTRNIVITGTDEAAPYALEGGHFIVYTTNTKQIIEGVEYLLMGQQGHLGRYNIHFHVSGDQKGNSIIRKNLIMHSKQRCIVIHATFNALVDSNVAYNTSGHCFMIEEGGETGNTFSNNFGLRTRAVTQKIAADETDDTPATFWITNPNNSYIGNAAGGSVDSGFWLELRTRVRGISLTWAKLNNTLPIYVSNVGSFSGNTAHSNLFAGYRAYPHGFMPRFNSSAANPNFWNMPVWAEIGNFNLYKNNQIGAFLHDTDHVVFSNSTFADNVIAIQVQEVQGVNITGHRIVGVSNNTGNPSNCQYAWGKWSCGPISGCTLPLAPGVPGRGVPWGLANQSILGVVFDQNREYENGTMTNILSNTTFSSFDPTCHVSAAVAVGKGRASYCNDGHGFKSLRFSTKSITNKIFLFPKTFTEGAGFVDYTGEVANMYAIRDFDGSIIGSPSGGYIVANNSALLPPSSSPIKCSPIPNANAYSCPNSCYRTVQLMFDEPGFQPYPVPSEWGQFVDGPRVLGDFSYIQVTRLADGVSFTMEGNLRQYATGSSNGAAPYPNSTRLFPMSLLSGYTYEITFVAPTNNSAFLPTNMTIQYKDGAGCGQNVTLRIKGSTTGNYTWGVQPSDYTTWVPCPGNAAILTTSVAEIPYTYACTGVTSAATQILELTLSTQLPAMAAVVVNPILLPPSPCSALTRCAFTATNTVWFYNQQNLDLHPLYSGGPAFYNPLYPTPPPAWLSGPAVFAYEGWMPPAISTQLTPPQWSSLRTYYFKSSFNVAKSACYSTLFLDIVVMDGLILYLNNVELMRFNMPAGTPDNMTMASSHLPGLTNYAFTIYSFSLPLTGPGLNYSLVEGANHFAAEVHVNSSFSWEVGFALRSSAVLDTSCSTPAVAPEVCDGVDNNNDGKVDVDPLTGKLLTRPCWSACGAGIQTCIQGAYQNCTAPVVLPEVCNGKDDNCDGLVDNGVDQLNCLSGQVCFQGSCRAVQSLTATQTTVGSQSSGWSFLNGGVSMDNYPAWKTGTKPNSTYWANGVAPFGVFPDNATWTFSTNLSSNKYGNVSTRYFVKSFALTSADAAATWGFKFGLRRADGAVVYLNGQEVVRSNMPDGAVNFTTLAAHWSANQGPTAANTAAGYYPYGPLRAYGAPVVTGINWVAVELHGAVKYTPDWVFDFNATRYVVQPCVGGGTACVRRPPVDSVFISSGDAWTFSDASLPLPAANWASVSFDDSSWITGGTPIGSLSWVRTNLMIGAAAGNNRTTYYFRKALTIPDGKCFYNLSTSILAVDGAVVYVNGAEAYRVNMPGGNITATTSAATWASWSHTNVNLGGAWLQAGANVIAVELHQFSRSTGGNVFDFSLSGQREGSACTPLPP